MKNLATIFTSIFCGILLTLSLQAQETGIFQTYAVLDVDGSGNQFYAGGINSDGATNIFDGTDFGNITSLVLNGGEVKTFKNNSGNVLGAEIWYNVHLASDPTGSFTSINLPFESNLVNAGDQRWQELNANVDILSGLPCGTYQLEVFWQSDAEIGPIGNKTPVTNFDSDFGNNFTATFTVTDPGICPSADLLLTPSSSSAMECDQLNVLVSVVTSETYNLVEARLNFDPNELQVVEVTAPDGSDVITSNPPFDQPGGPITADNTVGLVAYQAGATTDITGDIDFIRITFEVIGNSGTTSITPITSGFPRSRVVLSGFVDGVATSTDIFNDALPIDITLSPDTENPTFDCVVAPSRNTDSGTCSYTIQGTEFDPTNVDDNCGVATIVNDLNGTSSLAGETVTEGTMVTWTVTDENGNSNQCTFTITVLDNQPPQAICQNATVQLDTNGDGTLLASDIEGGSTDNCGVDDVFVLGCPEDLAFDQDLTSEVIFGDGNANGAFTIGSSGDIELGLRAKVRYPIPASVYNSNGDGSYNHIVGAFGGDGLQSRWNFDWSINTDADGTSGLHLNDLTYELGIDYDPSDDVNFTSFDLINQPFFDHSIGDNSTANSSGVEAADETEYASLIAANSLAQNSWRPNFFGVFDGNVNGRYEVYLKAFDSNGDQVAMTAITVIAGAGTGNAYAGCLSPLESIDFDCSDVGVNAQTLLVRDAGGNESTCVAQVTVEDNVAPTITCPADVTVELSTAPDPFLTGMATGSDNCGVTISYTDNRDGLTGCNETGVLVRTFTATDDAGNTVSCDQNITIEDTEAPEAPLCPADITQTADAGDCGAVVNFTAPESAFDNKYVEGFEDANFVSGSASTVSHQGWNNYGSNSSRQVSGTDGITSPEGGAHMVIDTNSSAGFTGAFSRLGGYSSVFGNGYRVQAAILIDLADAGVGSDTYGWDLSVASSGQDGGHQRDFIFHAASNAAGNVLIGGSNNTNFTRRNDIATLNHYEITASGWYTFEWVFRDNGTDVLAVDLNLIDDAGTVLWTETRSNPADVISTIVGGNRYMWFTFLEVEKLAIDEVQVQRNVATTCDAADGDTFSVGTTTVTCNATDACNNMDFCSFEVTVVDEEAPTAVCQNATVQLDTNGDGTLLASDIEGGSTDNCGVDDVFVLGCPEDLAFDQDLTSEVIFGTGNEDGAFTIGSSGDIELGLRAKVRYPSPASVYNSNGDGSYNHIVGAFGGDGLQSRWNFDWSINTNASGSSGLKLDDLTYELGIDYDPSDDVDFTSFDLINQPFFDHSIGDNSTANSAGVEAADETEYASLISANSLAQNSWRPNFFGVFDGNVDGRYEVYLKAFDSNGDQVAMTSITVIAGAGTGNTYAGCLSPLESIDFDCSDVGMNSQTLLVRDASGNESTCSAQITVEDNILPVAICQNITVQLDASGLASIVAADINFGSNDNCGVANISASMTDFTCADVGDNAVTLTVTDVNNNISSCVATVTVQDVIDPNAQCQSVTVQLDGSGTATVLPSQVDNGSSDICGVADLSFLDCPEDLAFDQDLTSEVIFGTGNGNGAYTIDNDNGQIELALRAKVRFPTPTGVYNSNGDGSYNHLAGAFGSGTDAGWNFEWSINTDADGTSGLHLNDLTYELGIDYDPSDNVDFLTFDLINQPFFDHSIGTNATPNSAGIEATDPTSYLALISANNVAQNSWRNNFFGVFDGNLDGRYEVYLKAFDSNGDEVGAVGITVIVGAGNGTAFEGCLMPLESLEYSCEDQGPNDVTLLVTDSSGNGATCTATVTVEDSDAPTITCPADIAVELSTAPDPFVTGMATGIDNCDVTISYTDNRDGLTGCNGTGLLVRTFTATDNAGNSVSCDQNITIQDTEAPEVPECPSDITQNADNGLCNTVVNFAAPGNALDNKYIEGFEDVNFESGSSSTINHQGWNNYASNAARQLSGTDGITSSEGGAHMVIDTNSSAGFTGAFSRLGGYSSVFGNGYRVRADIFIDLADAGVGSDTYGWDLSVSSSKQDGSFLRDFIFHAASNAAGNVLIGGSNNTNFTRRNDLASINSYEITSSGWYTFEYVFRDNGSDELTVDLNLIDDAGNILWTETRSNPADLISTIVGGNRYMWFTFLEVEKLAVDEVNVQRNVETICDASSGDSFSAGTTTITCTATDACGNSSTPCTFDVTVVDDQAPTAVCQNATVQLDVNGVGTLLASDIDDGSSDNCGVESLSILDCPEDLAFDQDLTSEVIFGTGNGNGAYTIDNDNGQIELALRAKVRFPTPTGVYNSNGDGSYNHLSGTFGAGTDAGWNFEWSINTDASGSSGLKLDDLTYELGIDYDPSDNVDFTSFDLINQPFFDHSIGDNSTANSSGVEAADETEYASLIAANSLAQNSWRPNFFGVFDGNVDGRYDVYLKAFDSNGDEVGAVGITVIVGAGTGTAFEGCLMPLESLEYSCDDQGPNDVTLLVTDSSGNGATCTATVTVEDSEAPTITCPANISVSNDAGECGANVSWTVPAGSDNCSVASVVGDAESGDFFPTGTTTVTYVVTDGSGNTADCSFTVTVTDGENPVIDCAASATVTVNQTNDTYLASTGEFDPTVSDNCPGATVTHDAAMVLSPQAGPNNTSLDGWEFPVGSTTITFTAVDAAGNTETCSITITVESAVISGNVVLNGACLPLDMTVSVYQTGSQTSTGILVATYNNVQIDVNGDFSIDASGIVPGSYDIYVKPENYLARLVANQAIDSSPTGIAISNLVPGDIDNSEDNVINGSDISLILSAYNTQDGIDAAYDSDADINCDGFVDALDLSLLVFFFLDGGDSPQL